ncbi:MAG: UvrD-helicase domain-containing protein, partial [Candidatus Eisenbacteria sp.]|nr:UvrD-helicase domain-containing protein [Candidatus Eisenbacteria bacterium]
MNLESALDPEQLRAVRATDGPVLVLAGPGSGKTRVLTHRVAWLVGAADVRPWRIMAVTFTNKAAGEMKDRLEGLIGAEALGRLTIGTFHSICVRVLRREGGRRGFDGRFVIFDTNDQLRTIKRVLEDLEIDNKKWRPGSVLGEISRAKNSMLLPGAYQPDGYWQEVVARLYERYHALLRASNALDFDDLLMETVFLLRDDPSVLRRYRERYRHIVVDEF